MECLGFHVLVELYDCDKHILNDVNMIEKVMVDSATKIGATILQVGFHQFAPPGVSGVILIAESHLTIHTWPELNYAAVDIFTCGDKIDPRKASIYISRELKASKIESKEIKRGKKSLSISNLS